MSAPAVRSEAPGNSPELGQPSPRRILRSLAPNLAINGLFPILLYQLLTGKGVSTVPALVAGSIFPLAYTSWSWVRTRHLDLIAGISLFFIAVSAAASLISGSTRFTLVKESVFTGLFGLVFLGSLVASRPLMFYMAREFASAGDSSQMAIWDDHWQHPGFRHAMRMMTVMWAIMFIADALIRVGLVFLLTTSAFLVSSQVLFYVMFALTLSATIAYGGSQQRKATMQPAKPPGY